MSSQRVWDQIFSLNRLNGKGARNFLNGQTTSDILIKSEGEFFLTCWLSRTGNVKALLEVKLDFTGAEFIVLAGGNEEIAIEFEKVIFPSDKVSIDANKFIRRLQIIDIPNINDSSKILWIEVNKEIPDLMKGIPKASKEEVEFWRLRKSLPLGRGEIDGTINPFELGLPEFVSLEKGCYLGQESIARLVRSGGERKKIIAWQSKFPISIGESLNLEPNSFDNNKKVGSVTSAMKSNNTEFLGLALVKKEYINNDILWVHNPPRGVRISIEDDIKNWPV